MSSTYLILKKLQLLVTQENILGKETKKEFSHPNRGKNKVTSSLVVKLGAELAACLIKEMLDPTKLTSQHLSSKGGRLSSENATQQEHESSIVKEATNENAEISFGSLTSQL